MNHKGHDKNSHVLKHCSEKEHNLPSLEDFMILETNYKKDKFRRKISELLYISSLAGTYQMSELNFFFEKPAKVFKPLAVFK